MRLRAPAVVPPTVFPEELLMSTATQTTSSPLREVLGAGLVRPYVVALDADYRSRWLPKTALPLTPFLLPLMTLRAAGVVPPTTFSRRRREDVNAVSALPLSRVPVGSVPMKLPSMRFPTRRLAV